MNEEIGGHNLVFITGIGKVFPFVRSHNILNRLQEVIDKGITWTRVTKSLFSVRFNECGYIFSEAGMKIFIGNTVLEKYICCFLNTNVCNKFLNVLSETINNEQGNIARIPIIENVKEKEQGTSYAVGCMFGRYSLDEEGIIFAVGEFDPS